MMTIEENEKPDKPNIFSTEQDKKIPDMHGEKTDDGLAILLVESAPTEAADFEKNLASDYNPHYRVSVVNSLSQGLSILDQCRFDAIILDLTRSDCAGMATLTRLRAKWPSVAVVVLVGKADHTLAARAAFHGAAGILNKKSTGSTRLSRIIRFAVERNKAECQVRFNEFKSRNFIEKLNLAYLEVDLSGVFTYANNMGAAYMGVPRENLLGTNSLDYNHTPEQRSRNIRLYANVFKTGQTGVLDSTLNRPDGSQIVLEHRASLIRDEKGTPTGFSGITRDVTERHRLQKALQESRDRYQNILDNMEDGYLEIDLRGRLTFLNETLDGLYGYSMAELNERDNRAYMDEKNARKVYAAFNRIYLTGRPQLSLQYEVITKEGSRRHAEGSYSLMKNNQGEPVGFRGVVRDITDRKVFEQALIRAKKRADAATLAKSEFLANMSHEIRTPMNGIIGMYTLLQNTDLTRKQMDYVYAGKQSADGLLTTINDILDFSKIEAGKLNLEYTDFNLYETIVDLVQLPAARAHARNIEFNYRIDHDVPTALKGDPGRLRQIMVNLAMNGVKFTRQGEVNLFVNLLEQSPTHATLKFSLKDTGIGINKADQDRLFTSFQQVDNSSTRKFGGTGLGLVIAWRLTRLMGGEMGVESEAGKGATFWLTIAFEKSDDSLDTRPVAPEEIRTQRILIVDDNQTNLDVLEGHLNVWGCSCDRATSAAMALHLMRAVSRAGAPYDLVICDMLMPEMDGAELGRRIKADPRLKETLLIILTSLGMRGDGNELKKIGFSGYLAKPVNPADLFDCIVSTVAGRSAASGRQPPKKLITRHNLQGTRRNKLRILLAEDNPINCKLALHLLARFGFKADVVSNGREAIEALSTTAYDLVLMDVQMPEMDGTEAARAIRDKNVMVRNPGVPIIAMTASSGREDRDACLAAGMNDFISKPMDPNDLLRIIEQHTEIHQD